MKIISPTFQKGHSYKEYDNKIAELHSIAECDNICIDMDFLHSNELEKYIKDILLGSLKKEFRIRSKSMQRVKEILTILDSYMIMTSDIAFGVQFYYVTVHN